MLTGLVALSTVLLAAAPAATPAPSAPPQGAAPAAAPAAKPAAPPKRFASEPLAFSVAFPCDPPRQQTVGGEPEQGPVKVHVFMCGSEQKGETAFGVSVMVPPAEGAKELANPEFVQALLQGLAAQIAKGTNGKVVREGPVRLGAVEGYETVVEGAGGRGRFRAFPHGGRVYQVIAIGATERAAEADAFVESFALDAR